jgi:hypothetical protein
MFIVLMINAVPDGTALMIAGFYGGESNPRVKQFTRSGARTKMASTRDAQFCTRAPGWIRTNEGISRQIYSLL